MGKRNYIHSYISELRKRIIAVAVFFIVALAIGMLLSKRLVLLFLNSNLPGDVKLVTLSPYENISLFIDFMFFVAIALTVPFTIYQLIAYIKPGLTRNERKIAILTSGIGVVNNWSINQFVKFVVYLSLAMGLIFQMPLLISMLVKFNILKPGQLKKARKHVIIGLLVLAAIITPTTDVFSMVVMAVPLILLFEASIFIAKFVKKDKTEVLKNEKGKPR